MRRWWKHTICTDLETGILRRKHTPNPTDSLMKQLLLLMLLVCAARPAAAQQPTATPSVSHVQAVERLLEVSDAEGAMRKGMQQMMDMQVEQNPMFASMRNIMEEFYATHLTWARMKPELVSIYADAFTEAEIRELTAFYQTELGRKMMERMPEVMGRSAEISQRLVQAHLPELAQKVMTRMQEDPEAMRRAMEEAQRMLQAAQPNQP